MPPPLAVNVALVVLQLSVADEGLMEADGGVVLWLTDALAVAVHPFAPVTVTVYVLALVTVMPAVVAPVLQE